MKIIYFIISFISVITVSGQSVYIIPTIHRLHQQNEQYNYDTIQSLINRLNPEVLVVEIRAEDLQEDTTYLKKYYPFEMWMAKKWFPEVKIEGFDWLGEEIRGQLIPMDYFDEFELKKLQQELSKDSITVALLAPCTKISKKRIEVLKEGTVEQIIQQDPEESRKYYECLMSQLNDTKYIALPIFYEERNRQMAKRLKEIINTYPGKRIVILTGADHLYYLQDQIDVDVIKF